jgi:hypothetical protein
VARPGLASADCVVFVNPAGRQEGGRAMTGER